jgi:hypothetical protein
MCQLSILHHGNCSGTAVALAALKFAVPQIQSVALQTNGLLQIAYHSIIA